MTVEEFRHQAAAGAILVAPVDPSWRLGSAIYVLGYAEYVPERWNAAESSKLPPGEYRPRPPICRIHVGDPGCWYSRAYEVDPARVRVAGYAAAPWPAPRDLYGFRIRPDGSSDRSDGIAVDTSRWTSTPGPRLTSSRGPR